MGFHRKVFREFRRPFKQFAKGLATSGLPGLEDIGRFNVKVLAEIERADKRVFDEATRTLRSPEFQLAATVAATAFNPAAGAAVAGGFQIANAARFARAGAGLPTLQSGPTVATRIQSESRSAILDLRARLRQSGSRGRSNQGIPQLNPLPSLQGPVLAGKLG